MPRAVVDHEGGRKADLAAIHIAKKQLGWDDDFYRDILWTVCRVKSSGELDITGRKRFLEHLRQCGFVNAQKRRGSGRRKAVSGELSAPQRLMFSLWQQLADAGLVHERRMSALVAFARRQTGVERLEWLKPRQEDLVIQSLRQWLERKGTVA
jgi:phage gp16-like protein